MNWKPTVVVTANGEVQTKEEAQSHVHDLDLFVTVQLLEETPAVPSLPKKGRQLCAKRTISVTLVVPGLSTNSESVSSSTSTLQDLCPTNPAQERSDVQASGNWSGSPPKTQNHFFKEWQSRFGRPFARSSWMVGGVHRWFRGHRIACTRTHFSGLRVGTSYERGIKIKEAPGFFTHFPNDRNCEVCFQTKMTRAPCRRRTGEALPLAEKFGDLMTAGGQGDGVSKACQQRAAADPGPEPACVQTPLSPGWHTQGREGRIDVLPWYRPVAGGKTGCGTEMAVLTSLGMRPGNRQSRWKRSKFRRRGGTLTLEKTEAPGCGDTTKASASFGSIWGGDQGNLSVAQFERGRPDGWKGGRPRVRLENRACEPARSPKITSAQGPQWGGWITEQSLVRCRCSRSCHSMDSTVSVQNKDSKGDGKEITKVPRAFTKAKSYLHGQLIYWSLANLVKFYRGIIELQHLIDPRRMALLKEP